MQQRTSPAKSPLPDQPTARLAAAVQYLQQCCNSGRSFGVLTGSDPAAIRLVLQYFTARLPATTRIARTLAPTDSSHAFLEGMLAQFGFEPFDATADDLQRLLTVVLRQGASQQAGTVVIIADAQDFGPRVLETIRELARNSRELACAPMFILTGHAGLNRVLDSQGMASVADLTRWRCSLDDVNGTAVSTLPIVAPPGVESPSSEPASTAGATLVLTREHEEIGRYAIDRDRLLIGRSELSDICLTSRFVSRQHALLLRTGDGVWLIDLRSTNGTIVNSEIVHQRRIEDGDVISLGNFRLRYEDPQQPARDGPRAAAGIDDLTATTVMRSLQAIRRVDAPGRTAQDGPAPTAA